MKYRGLRITRIPRWLLAIWRAAGRHKLSTMARKIWKAAETIMFFPEDLPPARVARRRYRTCIRCPMHDAAIRTCAGCGCYTPYLVSGMPQGNPCPLRKLVEDEGWE
jgi:hypothetical protein